MFDLPKKVEPLNYSIADTCTLLCISRPTVYMLHRQGILTIHKFGGKSLITAEAISACQRQMIDGRMPRRIRDNEPPRNPSPTRSPTRSPKLVSE